MDKNTYETYECIPANNVESEANQFYVVQEDGTFLLNRQVQYVAQLQDVKGVLESLQPCTVYDVTQQQFYVDVDNSSEHIPGTDQYVLPDGGNNLYANSYLLHPVSTVTEKMEEDAAVEIRESNMQMNDEVAPVQVNKSNNFTEITLSDEQYRILEQKGWILLETSDRIFVLDNLGLHDITTNEKLIQELKMEIENKGNVNKTEVVKSNNSQCILIENTAQSSSNQQSPINVTIQDNLSVSENNEEIIKDEPTQKQTAEMKQQPENPSLFHNISEQSVTNEETRSYKDGNTIKIKTNFIFKDIPDKIVLGEMLNGKKLIAKMVKHDGATTKARSQNRDKDDTTLKTETVPSGSSVPSENIGKSLQLSNISLSDNQLEDLIEQTLTETQEERCNAEDIASANEVISHLLRNTACVPYIVDRNLFITKITKDDESGKSRTKVVTGRVTPHENSWRFVYQPEILHKLTESDAHDANIVLQNTSSDFSHVHMIMTHGGKVSQTSITLNKTDRPLKKSSSFSSDSKRRQSKIVYACGACATTFQLEKDLKEHQEMQCTDPDDILTIDTDKIMESNICSLKGRGMEKTYTCVHCETKFTKLSNYRRHLKTHQRTQPIDEESPDNDKESEDQNMKTTKSEGMYKCKMCQSSYHHASTLSKHIVTRHIKEKSK